MVAITTLYIYLETLNQSGAETDGDVYVGIGGREFFIDTGRVLNPAGLSDNDFEQGDKRTYICGQLPTSIPTNTNIVEVDDPTNNDPGKPYPLDTDNLGLYPVYVRYEPIAGNPEDDWGLGFIQIKVNPNPETQDALYEALRNPDPNTDVYLFLGHHWGKYCYLHRV